MSTQYRPTVETVREHLKRFNEHVANCPNSAPPPSISSNSVELYYLAADAASLSALFVELHDAVVEYTNQAGVSDGRQTMTFEEWTKKNGRLSRVLKALHGTT
jgi:hypothetical protein